MSIDVSAEDRPLLTFTSSYMCDLKSTSFFDTVRMFHADLIVEGRWTLEGTASWRCLQEREKRYRCCR